MKTEQKLKKLLALKKRIRDIKIKQQRVEARRRNLVKELGDALILREKAVKTFTKEELMLYKDRIDKACR